MSLTDGSMNARTEAGVTFLTHPALDAYPWLRHAFSTRHGGASEGEFTSMNLSYGRGDPDANVAENYRRFCAAAGFDAESLVFSAQDHHTNIRRVAVSDRGKGFMCPRDYESVDGLITDTPGLTLVTHYADCVPLYFVDPVRRAIGLSHAGWRGTAGRIGALTVARMRENFGSRPEDLRILIGPSIGACCYEVGEPVADAFRALSPPGPAAWLSPKGGGKYRLDLWEANRQMLMETGTLPAHIFVAGLCTCCNSGDLFSHRATNGRRGGLAAFLTITDESEGRE